MFRLVEEGLGPGGRESTDPAGKQAYGSNVGLGGKLGGDVGSSCSGWAVEDLLFTQSDGIYFQHIELVHSSLRFVAIVPLAGHRLPRQSS